MRIPVHRLLAVLAAAILCLSPIAFATAVNADVAVDVGYARVGFAQLDDEVDVGRARDEIVVPAPDIGRARDEVVVPEPDIGRARNEIVLPEETPVPTPADTGIDAETWTVIALSGALVVAVGATVLLIRRRHHGHLAHPV